MGTELDVLVIGNFYLKKENQDRKLRRNYKDKYELDWYFYFNISKVIK